MSECKEAVERKGKLDRMLSEIVLSNPSVVSRKAAGIRS